MEAEAKPTSATEQRRFLSKLFNEGEGICIGNTEKAFKVVDLDKATDEELMAACFVCLNPLDKERDNDPKLHWHRADQPRRADANVTAIRNFLIEFDRDSLEDQIEELIELKVPYTTLTYSGGKSVHAVISLTEPLENKAIYVEVFKAFNTILPGMDPSCKNPSRLTRLGGSARPGTGVMQEVLDVRKRLSQEQLFTWLMKHEHLILAAEEAEEKACASQRESTERGELQQHTIDFLEGKRGTKGSRHNRLYAAACEMFDCGWPYEEAFEAIQKAADLHGVSSEPGRENEAETIVNSVYGGR